MYTSVPVIGIAPFGSGEDRGAAERAAVVRAIDAACTDIGFFTIAGHGVPATLADRMLETSRAFFDLPAAEKQRVARPRPEQSRGYIALGAENLSYSRGDASTTDLKEFFAIGPVDVPDQPYYRRPEAYPSFAPNLWPERPEELRGVWTEYYRTIEKLAARLMRLFALALGLHEEFFHDKTDRHISGIRANHYPEQVEPPAPGQIRAGAHTDYGAVTILLPENVPGLQVLNRQGAWVDVVAPPGTFVCNIGDCLMRWSNDVYVSTPHKVVSPSGADRYSVAFFLDPNPDAIVACLPTCVSPEHPAKYAPITGADFLRSRLEPTYAAKRA